MSSDTQEQADLGLARPVVSPPAPITTEVDFERHWLVACYGEPDAWALATLGGGVADRLAWVFASGYQAALCCCFDLPSGWSALAVSEAPEGDEARPPMVNEGGRLSGWKTWVAGVASVRSLVVSVPAVSGDGLELALLERPLAGLDLRVPASPAGFLPELSQGQAVLTDVEPQAWLEPSALKRFRSAEGCGVVTSLCSMLWHRHQVDAARASLLAARDLKLLARDEPDRSDRKTFLSDVASWVRELPVSVTDQVPGFERDRRLLAMMLPDLRSSPSQ